MWRCLVNLCEELLLTAKVWNAMNARLKPVQQLRILWLPGSFCSGYIQQKYDAASIQYPHSCLVTWFVLFSWKYFLTTILQLLGLAQTILFQSIKTSKRDGTGPRKAKAVLPLLVYIDSNFQCAELQQSFLRFCIDLNQTHSDSTPCKELENASRISKTFREVREICMS